MACHRCDVICEHVVYPSHCIRTSCRYVYAYTDGDTTYFGCVQKIFRPELDLAPMEPSSRRDVYGALLARRRPLRECQAAIEHAYPSRYSWRGCQNPLFRHDPEEYAPEAIRHLVEGPGDPAD